MSTLLFLSHRIPYPPDKGDKIRSFNVLRALSARYRVHLATFADAAEDMKHIEDLKRLVNSLECRRLPRIGALARSVTGLFRGQALSLPYYWSRALQSWIDDILDRESIDIVYVFSSSMGQYVQRVKHAAIVVDFCDVDSDKWRQYGESRSWPLSAIFRREARYLLESECRLARLAHLSLLVSDAERRLFLANCDVPGERVLTVRNGVDTQFFDPASQPARDGKVPPTAVFTGAMDYWANVDAVSWFVDEVWPAVRRRHANARFQIVGARPAEKVRQLGDAPGVEVVGRVPDVRPYLAQAKVVVAPLRIARGVQNKVLEALAMARPLVATPAAMAGLDSTNVPGVQSAESAQAFSAAVIDRLADESHGSNPSGREFVMRNFSWGATLAPLLGALDQVDTRRPAA